MQQRLFRRCQMLRAEKCKRLAMRKLRLAKKMEPSRSFLPTRQKTAPDGKSDTKKALFGIQRSLVWSIKKPCLQPKEGLFANRPVPVRPATPCRLRKRIGRKAQNIPPNIMLYATD